MPSGLFQVFVELGNLHGTSPFPGFLHFTVDLYLIMLSARQGGIKYHFLRLDLGLNPFFPDNWQTIGPVILLIAKLPPQISSKLELNTEYIIKGFQTIVFIFFLISTTFRSICPPASSGICRTQEPSRNFELRPLLNPRGSSVLIPLAITRYKC